MATTRGYQVYRGPSRIDGAPIVGLATMSSGNEKTGNTIQTWIMRADMPPVEARACGADRSVCGTCPMHARCYVNLGQAPRSIHKAWRAGNYPKLDLRLTAHRSAFGDRMLRAGSYGDPTAISRGVWDRLRSYSARTIGYTHRWREVGSSWRWLMASTETLSGYAKAKRLGWRSFRARLNGDFAMPDEIECPGSDTLQCVDCGLCNGAEHRTAKKDIVTDAHGLRVAPFGRRPSRVTL